MVDLRSYSDKIKKAWELNDLENAVENPRQSFFDHLRSQGFDVYGNVKINEFGHFNNKNHHRRNSKTAWYIYNEYENNGNIVAFANYGDFSLGFSSVWTSKSQKIMDDLERKSFFEAQDRMREKIENEKKRVNKEAAEKSYQIWSTAPVATEHEYLTRKKISGTKDVKVTKSGKLIIPMAYDGKITSLQYIDKDGGKRFKTGGRASGAWFYIDGDQSLIYITEGFATAKSINEATGHAVYVSFNAGNIYPVAEYVKNNHKDSFITIAGDDDREKEINVGRAKAEQAASGLGLSVVFPPVVKDFNDYHVKYSLEALKELLKPSVEKNNALLNKPEAKDGEYIRPPGVLGAIYDYYKTTDGFDQKGFAIQTALAVCSTVLGRSYKTNFNNYSSIFLLNVGKTATGKEHIKTVYNKILLSAGKLDLIAGDGYTAGSAVISTLIDKPRHGTCIDELGLYLEASRGKNPDKNQRDANKQLMEAITRNDGILYPKNYSTMTGKKDSSTLLKNRIVHNPAITLISMTTPVTFYNTIDVSAIQDGFINRFIIYTSDMKRKRREDRESIDVPNSIIDWIENATDRYGETHVHNIQSNPIILTFTKGAIDLKNEFYDYCIEQADRLEPYLMDGLSGRSAEMAMRVSLICALAENPYAEVIKESHMEWAIWWVKRCLDDTIKRLKLNISSSDFESSKKKVLQALESAGLNGVTWSSMQKLNPYSEYKIKELREILQSLRDAELIIDEHRVNDNGKATQIWTALK